MSFLTFRDYMNNIMTCFNKHIESILKLHMRF